MPKVLVNKARCLACGDIVESRTVHDFRRCSCEALAVDGGLDYVRRVYRDEYEELSEYAEEPTDA